MILEIFKDSLEYSYKDYRSLFKLVILLFLSIFLLPIFFVTGYLYRITNIGINGTINGNDPLPNFENLGRMFVEGIKIILVRFIYLLPGTIIFLVFFGTMACSTLPDVNNGVNSFQTFSFLLSTFGIMALTIVLWIIFYLFSTVAIPNMISNNGSLKAAFDFKEIIGIIKSIGFFRYIKFYLGCIILFFGLIATVMGIMVLLVGSITFLADLLNNVFATVIGVIIVSSASFVVSLILISFFLTFESRAIALIYNMRELT